MPSRPRHNLLTLAVVAALVCGWAGSALADLITGSSPVNGAGFTDVYTDAGTTYGPYGWTYSYTRGFDGTQVYARVGVNFLFDAALGYSNADKAAYRLAAETSVESKWNNRFSIRDNTTQALYPITIDLATTGTFNQSVTVKPGSGGTNMNTWYLVVAPSVQAHEFGHMLGLFDEYIGGAIDHYPNPTLSSTGIMGLGANLAQPAAFPRYFQQYLDYMNVLNPGQSFSLVAIPEPASWLLAAVALCVLAVAARHHGATGRRPCGWLPPSSA